MEIATEELACDMQAVERLKQDIGDEYFAKVVAIFLKELGGHIHKITGHDDNSARRALHNLKTHLATFGYHGLAAQAREFESQLTHQQSLDPQRRSQFVSCLGLIEGQLNQHLGGAS